MKLAGPTIFLLLCAGGAGGTGGVARADGELALLRATDGRGQSFDAARFAGQVVALTFGTRYTRDQISRINESLASRARAGDMIVLSVIDFQGIPQIAHGYARRKVGESDRPGRILHLVDESGGLRAVFGTQPGDRVDILVVDRAGKMRGRFVGEHGVDAALALIDELRSARAGL